MGGTYPHNLKVIVMYGTQVIIMGGTHQHSSQLKVMGGTHLQRSKIILIVMHGTHPHIIQKIVQPILIAFWYRKSINEKRWLETLCIKYNK